MASLEFALLVTSIIVSLMLVSFTGRFYSVRGSVYDATAEAARAASLKQNSTQAGQAAYQSAEVSLGGLCDEFEIETNTQDFKPGGVVEVDIDCKVSLLGLSLLAIPGEISLKANAREVIDRYRAESPL